ncbi:sensor histidine kinase [Mycoplasmatota bacterium]|nr:sensor histidine kinase [Mycoplasmatota bacterium]
MKLFKEFIKDYLGFILVYFISTFCMILYFYLETNISSVIYPIGISLFLLIIFLGIRYYQYDTFRKSLNQVIVNNLHEVESFNNLQKSVSDLIKKLRKETFEEQRAMTTKLNNNKQFFSHWIHTMKTPISVIDLIIQKIKSGESLDISDIDLENKKLLNLLEQVLNLIRLDDFETDFQLETIDLVSLIHLMINERKKEFIYKNIYPKVNVSDKKIDITTDVKWNRIIIDQLINNALKYSNPEKKLIFEINQNNQKVTLSIKDEGIGIPEYDLYRLFEPFFTGSNGRQSNNSSGIGLFVVKQICDKLNHHISIESEVGVGTEVTITYLTNL